jgi:ribonuclease HI
MPTESLSPLAAAADRVLAAYGYDVSATVDAVDATIAGVGGLFDPRTDRSELTAAFDRVLEDPDPPVHGTAPLDVAVLYVDGSSRGNPGPAGAGAVLQNDAGEAVARLGGPVGSHADNNTAEYAALHLGLTHLLGHYDPTRLEVRIDSMTVVRDVWQGEGSTVESHETYRDPIRTLLGRVENEWTHLADHEPNPADALATVGADLAALGPGG